MSDVTAPARPPRTAQLAAVLTVLTVLPAVIAVILLVGQAGQKADDILRDHPQTSHSVALAGVYLLAGGVAIVCAVSLLAARGIQRGRRWAWIVLLILGAFGVTSVLRAPSLLGTVEGVISLLLVVMLLLPDTRRFVASRASAVVLETPPR